MAETDFNIDEAEQAYNQARGEGAGDQTNDGGDGGQGDGGGDEQQQQQQQQQQEQLPPGFKTYEEWVAEGNDPDDYVGKKAYERQYNNIQQNKALTNEVKELKSTVQQTVDATNALLSQQDQQHKAELEAALAQAKEDDDVEAALDAQQGLDEIDARAQQRQQQQATAPRGEHAEIAAFREANPMLDRDSDQFDEDFNADVEAAFNNLAAQGLTQTDAQVKKALKAAHRAAKALNPEKFESPRNNRGQQQQRQQQRQTQQQQPQDRAEDYKIANPMNGRDTDASGVRDMIHKTAYDNAIKAGKSPEDAKKDADTEARNFERSLAQ